MQRAPHLCFGAPDHNISISRTIAAIVRGVGGFYAFAHVANDVASVSACQLFEKWTGHAGQTRSVSDTVLRVAQLCKDGQTLKQYHD